MTKVDKLVESKLGDKVSTTYIENVKYGPDAERVYERNGTI